MHRSGQPGSGDSTDRSCDVTRFAQQTLCVLVDDLPQGGRRTVRRPLEVHLAAMTQAAVSPDRGALDLVLDQMRVALISGADIVEQYIPRVARRLGTGWEQDTLDFRAVTVGTARLQGLLRRFGADWNQRGHVPRGTARACLVAVPEGCQHTLGASVLAGQLRCRGFAVDLALDVAPSGLGRRAATASYAAVMISASGRERVETLHRLVQTAKRSAPGTPVLIGGNILDHVPDIGARTQADLATCDLDAALRFCGLDEAASPVALPAARRAG